MPHFRALASCVALAYVAHVRAYDHTAELVKDKYSVSWTIAGDEIQLELAVSTTGWIGFGISEAGGMRGADMAIASVSAAGVATVEDSFSVTNGRPSPDVQQDWVVVGGSQTASPPLTTIQLTRKLDTDDGQDWPIADDGDPTRLVLAFGAAGADPAEDALAYHMTDRWATRLDFFNAPSVLPSGDRLLDPLAPLKARADVHVLEFKNTNYAVPRATTTYQESCMDIPADTVTAAAHILGFQHVLEAPGAQYNVHHFLLYGRKGGCSPDPDADADMGGELIWGWGPGMEAFVFPDDTGVLIMGDEGYRSLSMQTHFDNPSNVAGELDNSGVEVYYTPNLNSMDVGVLTVGDPSVSLLGTALPEGYSNLKITCPASCLNAWAGDKTVFGQQLHMHQEGSAMRFEQKRGGAVVHTVQQQYYDFSFQDKVTGGASHYTIKPGDAFDVDCIWNNQASNTIFGPASGDEMCMSFIYYYPKLGGEASQCGLRPRDDESGVCQGTSEMKDWDGADVGFRVFGMPGKMSELKLTGAPQSESALIEDPMEGMGSMIQLMLASLKCPNILAYMNGLSGCWGGGGPGGGRRALLRRLRERHAGRNLGHYPGHGAADGEPGCGAPTEEELVDLCYEYRSNKGANDCNKSVQESMAASILVGQVEELCADVPEKIITEIVPEEAAATRQGQSVSIVLAAAVAVAGVVWS